MTIKENLLKNQYQKILFKTIQEIQVLNKNLLLYRKSKLNVKVINNIYFIYIYKMNDSFCMDGLDEKNLRKLD